MRLLTDEEMFATGGGQSQKLLSDEEMFAPKIVPHTRLLSDEEMFAPRKVQDPVKQNTSLAGDLVTDLKIGTQGIPGTLTGLGDIAAGAVGLNRPFDRAADYLGEKTGFQPAKWAKTAEREYSPDRQAV